MLIVHYFKDEVRDLTIELSNMFSCPMGCAFCESGSIKQEPFVLKPFDFIKQLNTCIKESGFLVKDFKKFYVSFAGIGEPSLAIDEIENAMLIIHNLYPHVQFNIATFGVNLKCFERWSQKSLPVRTIQVPFYCADEGELKKIVKNLPKNYNTVEVVDKAIQYFGSAEDCRIKINYIVMENINDNLESVEKFCELFDFCKNIVTVKISYLNPTKKSRENSIKGVSEEKILSIKKIFDEHDFRNYVFGTVEDCELGCGQLIQQFKD